MNKKQHQMAIDMEELSGEDLEHVTGGNQGQRRSPSPSRFPQDQHPADQPNEQNVNDHIQHIQHVNNVQQAMENLDQAIQQMPRGRRQERRPRQNVDNLIIRPQHP